MGMDAKSFGMRILQLLLVTWGAVTIVFFVGRVLPVEPALVHSGPNATPEMVAATRERLGLDQPLGVQYIAYLGQLVRGDLGQSLMTGRDVAVELQARLPASLELIVVALLLAGGAALALAMVAAARPGGVVAQFGDALAFTGTALPTILLGVMLVFVFYLVLPWAPPPLGRLGFAVASPPRITGFLLVDSVLAGRWDAFRSAAHHLVLPAITLALSIFPQLFRVMRENIAAGLRSDALVAVRLAGVKPYDIWRHYVLPLAAGPGLTLLAASFGYLVGGTVLVEHIFSWNGLGSYVVQAIEAGDYSAVQGVVLVSALAYSLGFFLADWFAMRIDPRWGRKDERHGHLA